MALIDLLLPDARAMAFRGEPRLPARAGLGLKSEHFQFITSHWPDIGFFEIHAENYMVSGGPFHNALTRIRERYPLSIHGVGLSLGGEEPLNQAHLQRLADLLIRYQPASFSEHLAWSSHNGHFLNDLLPISYTPSTLQHVSQRIEQIQDRLKRQILIENPASYLVYKSSTLPETAFINQLIKTTGCGLLLDVNNIYVSSKNNALWSPSEYLDSLDLSAVKEIHLAGFSQENMTDGTSVLIDSHATPIDKSVWALYQQVLQLCGPVATLIERDGNIPCFPEMMEEVDLAERALKRGPYNGTAAFL